MRQIWRKIVLCVYFFWLLGIKNAKPSPSLLAPPIPQVLKKPNHDADQSKKTCLLINWRSSLKMDVFNISGCLLQNKG